MNVLNYFLFAVTIVALFLSLLYSIRYRMQKEPLKRGLYAARMNMSMGAMLLAMGLVQMFLFEVNRVRAILAAVFLLLGLFNLFAGIRNHSAYSAAVRRKSESES